MKDPKILMNTPLRYSWLECPMEINLHPASSVFSKFFFITGIADKKRNMQCTARFSQKGWVEIALSVFLLDFWPVHYVFHLRCLFINETTERKRKHLGSNITITQTLGIAQRTHWIRFIFDWSDQYFSIFFLSFDCNLFN